MADEITTDVTEQAPTESSDAPIERKFIVTTDIHTDDRVFLAGEEITEDDLPIETILSLIAIRALYNPAEVVVPVEQPAPEPLNAKLALVANAPAVAASTPNTLSVDDPPTSDERDQALEEALRNL